MSLNIIIRADASADIGTGHITRCLTLSDELSRLGADVSFICREETGNLIGLIEKKGYKAHRLPAGIDLESDMDMTMNILKGLPQPPDWLLVDHYDIGAAWESSLRAFAGNIMVIDDLANREHDCDVLLDQNYDSNTDRYKELLPDHCTCLLGPEYALLRPEFLKVRERTRRRTGEVRRILIFMGGSDFFNQTGKVLRALEIIERDDIHIDIVIGPLNSHREEIEKIASARPNYKCHFNVENMAQLMADADLGIGAGGTTTWERCCTGLPSLVITVADNQVALTRELSLHGFVFYSGWYKDVTEAGLADDIRFVLDHPALVLQSSLKALELVDGRGTERVAGCLSGNSRSIYLRTAQPDDCRKVFEWRNHPDTRKHCFDPSPLVWEKHKEWFATVLSSSDTTLFIGESSNAPVGVLRYDFNNEKVFVSIYLVPELTGKGIGTDMLQHGTKWIMEHHPEIQYIIAKIKPQNIASEKAFKKAGFRKDLSCFIYECKEEAG